MRRGWKWREQLKAETKKFYFFLKYTNFQRFQESYLVKTTKGKLDFWTKENLKNNKLKEKKLNEISLSYHCAHCIGKPAARGFHRLTGTYRSVPASQHACSGSRPGPDIFQQNVKGSLLGDVFFSLILLLILLTVSFRAPLHFQPFYSCSFFSWMRSYFTCSTHLETYTVFFGIYLVDMKCF